jgi:hypothetical protein
MTLIAEDLLLLLLDDETGALRASSQIQVALGGAVLAELALGDHVVVGEKQGFWHTAKVRAKDPRPEHPLLAEAWTTVGEKERSAQDLVSRLGKGLKDRIATDLAGRGLLRREEDRVLGVFPRTRWPAADSTHEAGVRRELEAALHQGQEPQPRAGSLVAILSALDQAHKVLDHPGMSNGEVKKRAKAIAQGDWAAKGVADAIAATNAAVTAAIAGGAVAGSSS